MIIKLSEISKLPPETIVAGVRGNVKVISEYVTGVQELPGGGKRNWSLQNLILEQDGVEMPVEVAMHPVVPNSALGRGLHLLSHERQGSKALVGVKVAVENGQVMLRVTAKGELVFMDTAANLGGAKAEAAPVSAQNISWCGKEPGVIRPEPSTAAPAASAGASTAIAPGTLSAKDRRARITELVLLYDECLMAVLAGVGNKAGDNSGLLMAPEGIHAATKSIFDMMLSRPQP